VKESAIEANVNKYAKSRGWLVFKFVSPNERGVPDRMYIKEGRMFFIEFKAPGKLLTPLQRVRRKQLMAELFMVYVVDSVEKGRRVIDAAA
jgi:hypothetical protein